MPSCRRTLLGLTVAAVALASCGDDDVAAGEDRPTVVVTTTALGDIVERIAGDEFDVITVMPVGVDPHDFQASARQANQMREADALVVNGAGLEEGLLDVIEAAEADGVPTFEAITAVEAIEFGEAGHDDAEDDHGEHGQAEEGHAEEDQEHDHEGEDPHFFLDPSRTAAAVAGIGEFLGGIAGVDPGALDAQVDEYVTRLEALDAEVEAILAGIPDGDRVLVTNHDAFGYFADRYGFEIVGTVIPSGSTADGASAGALADLADVVRDEGVPAIFSDDTSSDDLAQALAGEVGQDVEVVALFTESLGETSSEAATYEDMIRTNARRIADALGA